MNNQHIADRIAQSIIARKQINVGGIKLDVVVADSKHSQMRMQFIPTKLEEREEIEDMGLVEFEEILKKHIKVKGYLTTDRQLDGYIFIIDTDDILDILVR